MSDELATWSDALEAAIAESKITRFGRIVVLRETASTQDAAAKIAAGGEPGLVVLAGRQSAGRGRLGRAWSDAEGEGLAATFVLDAQSFEGAHLSLAAGIGASRAIEHHLPASAPRTALRWPNDVVERGSAERKLAGVLIEVRARLALVGIGINIHQRSWPAELACRAVSLAELGSRASRLDVAIDLLRDFDTALGLGPKALCEEWSKRNILRGRPAVFEYQGARYEGRVVSLTPENDLVLLDAEGRERRLPAAHTSLIHSAAPRSSTSASQDCPAT